MAAKKKEKEKEKKETKLVVEEVVEEPTKTKEEIKEDEKEKEEPRDQEVEESPEEEKQEKQKEDLKEEVKEEIKEVAESKVTIKQVLMIAIPTAIIVAALTGGILFYMNNSSVDEDKPSKKTSSTPTAQQTSTPTPAPTLKRSDLLVKVLNGSGIGGKAGDAQSFLEGLGYEDIETGNASSFDYEETVVSIKEDKEEYLDMIIKDLSEEYEVSSESGTLDEDSLFDIEITIGKS